MFESTMLNYLLIPLIVGMFLGVNMGASGVGASFSAAYGAKIIRKSVIPGLFGLMVLLGALIGGKQTSITMSQNILPADNMSTVIVTIIMFSVALSLLVANLFGIPQSTSQSTVLAIIGVTTYFNNMDTEFFFTKILPTWFIYPFIAFLLCFLAGKYIYQPLRRKGYTMRFNRERRNKFRSPVSWGIIFASLLTAFSIGANNVANAVGPMAQMLINDLGIQDPYNQHQIFILTILIVAPCFAIGSSLMGNKILNNTGREIFLFGRIEALIIGIVSGGLLLTASLVDGIPISEVQLSVASIIGIGVAKLGFKNIFKKTQVNKFFIMWLISPIIAFTLAIALTHLAVYFNLL